MGSSSTGISSVYGATGEESRICEMDAVCGAALSPTACEEEEERGRAEEGREVPGATAWSEDW